MRRQHIFWGLAAVAAFSCDPLGAQPDDAGPSSDAGQPRDAGRPPTPTVQLTATPASIESGQDSTLAYSSAHADSCMGTGFSASGVSGAVAVMPTTTSSYTITCQGAGGSAMATVTVIVTAAPTVANGRCGSANAVAAAAAPQTNLCAAGTATSVSGAGPWSWSCAGSNGGSTATCSAPTLLTPVANYFVSGTGNDSNTGTAATAPFRTIQRAADKTMPGDVVMVMSGTYVNASPSGYVVHITRSGQAGAPITYRAYPGHSPKLQFNGWAGFTVEASYIVIDGFEIEGNNANITFEYAKSQENNLNNGATSGNGITINGSNAAVRRNIVIRNNLVHHCGGGGIGSGFADYITIENNVVHSNAWYSPFANSGISLWEQRDVDGTTGLKNIVRGNRSYDNASLMNWRAANLTHPSDGNGIIIDTWPNGYKGRTRVENNLSYSNGGSGIHALAVPNLEIINNSTYQNSKVVDYGEIFVTNSANARIMNNVMVARPGKPINSNYNNIALVYDYNILFTAGAIAVRGQNDLLADPKYVNPAMGTLSLESGSPAINSGNATYAPQTDFAGQARPQGGTVDRGAYEQ